MKKGLAGESVHTAGCPETCPECGENLVVTQASRKRVRITCRTKGCANFNESFPLDKPENGGKMQHE